MTPLAVSNFATHGRKRPVAPSLRSVARWAGVCFATVCVAP
ncbi:hypothetical protein ENSA5_24050 [Enhygromyxa salina]|uniref:Uncharacterized protein n=1 Tax=Enhygromyxa salina TaxID=215803 RepID=A0A2S9YB67_9BACT|nr:hypothetical protein ENSA5_24050 [Enhygromyxa salina]